MIEQDWDLLKATQDSLREHMLKVKELEAELAKQTALDKKADNARELGLDYEPEQEPVLHLWECIGRWSAYLVLNGKQANMAPPVSYTHLTLPTKRIV